MNSPADLFPAGLTTVPEEATLSPMSADELFSDLSAPVLCPDAAPGFGSVSGSGFPSVGREAATASSCVAALKAELGNHIEAFSAAHVANNEQAADDALRRIERTRLAIASLEKCSEMLASPGANTERAGRGGGLTLNRRDLPKFQLAASIIKPFPSEEVFESVGHFLRTFENVIESSSLDIEKVWMKFLPLCLPHTDDGWVETDLKKCNSWKSAKSCFNERHGSSLVSRRFTDQVFTMVMKNTESIGDYSKKFLRAVYNAGLNKDDPRIADRFLASLALSVQTLIKVTMARSPNGEAKREWTVEQITQIGRDILGDDNRLYAEATRLIPGAHGQPEKKYEDHPRKKPHHHTSKITKHEKTFFCSHHGKNPTHESSKCFTLINRKNKASSLNSRNPCRRCGENYHHGHVCKSKNNEPILMVSQSPAKDKSEQTLKAIQDRIDEDMEEISFECKYLLDRIERRIKANDAFNLTTPIIIENQKLIGMIDTGSSRTFINLKCLNNNLQITKINASIGSFNFLSKNSSTKRLGKTDPLNFKYINGITFKHAPEVLEFNMGFNFDILLGRDILAKMNIGLINVAYDIEGEYVHSDNAKDYAAIYENLNIDKEKKFEPDNSPAGTAQQRAEFMSSIKEALEENKNIPVESYCPLSESIIRLPTKEGATAYRRQYPIPHALRPTLDKQVKEWLETGTIVKSKTNTSFNSPMLLVPKRNKAGEIVSHRVCLDVRLLNQILPPTFNYPIPKIQTIFQNLSGKKFFTTLDLSNAYHRFKVAPEDVHKLTFTHLDGQQYSFIKGCFGLKMLTSQFQHVMATLFDKIDCVQNFVDDCIVASETFEQHVKDVKLVIEKLSSAKLILNSEKCVWFQHSVRLLGFVVNETGTKVDKRKLTNVDKWPIPRTAKQIQQFMGLINYFRDYIPMISKVAEPISRLSHAKNVSDQWTDEQTQSFKALKDILHKDLILHYADMSREMYVATDASLYGAACLLFQRDEQGRDKYISFVSTSLSPSQRRWSTTKRELYAVVLALEKFRPFLWGRQFTIFTDHRALIYLHTQKIANPMMIGWIETLLDFDFKVVHIPGLLNKLPDLLSRLYPPEDSDKLVEDDGLRKIRTDNLQPKSRVIVRKKKYSKDRVLNVLATQLVENVSETSDYMSPPEEKRNGLLKEAHSFGHFGSQAIVNDLHSQGLHWTNIYEEAKEIIRSCPECQKHNISKRGYHPLTNVVAFRPFDHVAIDLCGEFPVSEDGHTYMLVLVDVCSKYVILRPLPNKNSTTIAKALIKIFGDYGFPKVMQSDNGLEFRNSLMSSLSKELGIDRRYSTAYHPQGNGIAEASVKIAENTVRKMMRANSNDWCHYLPIVQLCINRHIPQKTLSAPFSLMYARRVNYLMSIVTKENTLFLKPQ
ncbi:hypothetical protein INT47_012821 [Mucor saturninus]|uniref:RNA-directed DNA polymerase n=1 Tax=Mucor saturninus TaxID=64648 RepID=A0A8H7QG35_9FUNG|nr:hypothetical protein INT47_012821 [Mucor saturninus]